MAYDFSSLLSMAQAHFVSEAAQPQQKDEQLTVFWENIPPQLLREAREWLVDNRLSVEDFTVEHKQYEGTWHLVSLQAGEQVKTGRVQAVFQKGYATSLTWALARLTNAKLAHTNASTAGVADSSSDNPIRYLNVRFPNIDRRAVNSIISGIATTYTNVQISSETYSGEWHVVYATSGLQQEGQKDNDGAAFIEIFLAKPQYTLQTKRNAGTPQERTVWYCWDVPQAIAQSVIDTFEGTGTSVSANNNSAQNLVDLILESSTPESGQRFSLSSVACSQRVYDYVYRSVSNPDAYALPSTSTDGVIYSREEALNDDGTYNVFIKATLSRSRIFEFESFSAPFASESTISYRANTGVIQAPPSGLGGVYRLRQDVNPDCTYDADLTYKAGLNAGEAIFGSERSGLSAEDRAVYRDRTSQVTAPEPGQRGIYQADNQLTEEGLYNSTLQYRTSTARELEFESQATKFRRQSEHVYRNSDTPINAPIPGAGGLYRVEQQINPDLTYDARLVYTSGNSQGQAEFNSQSSELVSEASIIYRDMPNQINAPSASQGQIYQATNQLTDEGLYNASLQYQVSKPDVTKFKSQATRFRSESTITYRNSRAVIEAPTPASSGMYRVSQRENQDGTYDAELTYSSGTNAGEVSFTSERSSLLNEHTAIYKDRTSKVDANPSSQGVVYQATNQLTDEGLYSAQVVGRASVEGKIDFRSRSTPFKLEQVSTYRNTKTMPSVPSVNTGAYQMSAQLNADGTYDVSVAYTTKSNSPGRVDFSSEQSSLSVESTSVYKDRDQKVEAPASGRGYIYRSDNQLTEEGLYNATLQYRVSRQGTANFQSRITPFKREDSRIYRNYMTMPDIPDTVNTGAYQLSAQLNQDGTYDASVSYTTKSSSAGMVDFSSEQSSLSVESTSVYKDRDKKAEAPSSGQGYIYRADNQMTEDGLYNSTIQYRASREGDIGFLSRLTPFKKEDTKIYRNQRAIPSFPSDVDTGSYQISGQLNQDGTYDFSVAYTTKSSSSGRVDFASEQSSLLKESTSVYKDRDKGVEAPASGQGYIYRADNQMTEDGLYNSTIQYRASQKGEIDFLSRLTPFKKEQSRVYRNYSTLPDIGESVNTGAYQVSAQLNIDGTYDFSVAYVSPSDSNSEISFASTESQLLKEATAIYKDAKEKQEAPASGQGYIYQADNQVTDDGLYNSTIQYRVSNPASLYALTEATRFKREDTTIYRNMRSVPAPSVPSGSGRVRASFSINQDGTYDAQVSSSTFTGGGYANLTSTDSVLVHVDEVVYRDYGSVMSAPASSQGVIGRASTQITDDGLYNGSSETITSNAASVSGYTDYTAFRSETTSIYRNSRTLPEAPSITGSGRSRASFTINQDGTYDAQVSVSKSTGGGADSFTSLYSHLSSSFESIYRDRTSSVSASGGSIGVIVRATNQITDDGLYNGSVEEITSSPYSASALSDSTAFRKETVTIYRNSRAVPAATVVTGSGRSRASFSVNQDGTFDGQIVYSESTGGGSATFTNTYSALASGSETVYRDSSTPIAAASTGVGVISRASNQITDDGLYNGSVETITSTAYTGSALSDSTAFKSETTTVYRNARSIPAATSISGSGRSRSSFSVNQDGTFDGQIVYTQSKASGSASFTSAYSALFSSKSSVYKDTGSAISASSSSIGTISRASNQITEEGLYNATLETTTSTPYVASGLTDSTAFRKETTTIYRNSKTAPLATPQTGSGRSRSSFSVNEDGTFDGQVVYSESTGGGSATFSSIYGALVSETETVYRSANSAIEADNSVGQGVISRATNRITEEGLYDATITRTTSSVGSMSFTSRATPTKLTTSTVYKNNRAVITGATQVSGGAYFVSGSINTDGTYDFEVQYQTGTSASFRYKSESDAESDTTTDVYRGYSSQVNAPSSAAGFAYSATQSIEEDGTYSATISSIYGKTIDSGWLSEEDDDGTSIRRVAVNATVAQRDSILNAISNQYTADWSVTPSKYQDRWNVTVAMRSIPDTNGVSDPAGKNIRYSLTADGDTYDIDIKLTRNRTIAKSHMSGNTVGSHGGEVAGIRWLGRGWWKAVKIS